jgi:hypothetical protein
MAITNNDSTPFALQHNCRANRQLFASQRSYGYALSQEISRFTPAISLRTTKGVK